LDSVHHANVQLCFNRRHPTLSLAVLALGAVLSAAIPLLTSDELAAQARDAEPFLALTIGDLAPKLRTALTPRRVVLIEELLAGVHGHDEWAARASDDEGDGVGNVWMPMTRDCTGHEGR
ncbi:hypothetical protein EJB05_46986, partial [Eragrostis curvula]